MSLYGHFDRWSDFKGSGLCFRVGVAVRLRLSAGPRVGGDGSCLC